MDLSLLNIDPVLALLAIGTIAGVVEGIKRLFDKDYKASGIILASGVVGGLLGLLLPFNETPALSVVMGLVIGFSTTGYVTIVQNVGGKY